MVDFSNWLNRFKCNITYLYSVYGMTETMMCCMTPGNETALDNVGKLINNVKVKFIDEETGKPNPRGKPGEIVVKSPSVSF